MSSNDGSAFSDISFGVDPSLLMSSNDGSASMWVS
jgi:hypothetical protein